MLIQTITHHPEAIVTIVQRTPVWVWGLLAGLLYLGYTQLSGRRASFARVMVMPVAMTGFSVYGLISAFGGSGFSLHLLEVATAWLLPTAAVAAVALTFTPDAPAGTRYDAATRTYAIPGSWVPMALIVGIFMTKYLVGVELAMQPALMHDAVFTLAIPALYGAFNGLFVARATRLLRLALRGEDRTAAAVAATA